MKVRKSELRPGLKVRCNWKGKLYEGTILRINPEYWAKITKGRFIAVDLLTNKGIVGMPYTNKAEYQIIEK